MISKSVLKNPTFAGLPNAAQLLYCHLVLETDDEGFIDNARAVQKGSGFYAKSLRLLQENHFVHIFDSGVGVIIHWHWMNKIQPSKVKKTLHTAEKAMLTLDESMTYQLRSDAAENPPKIT